jgi:hypothetical protein
LIDTDIIKIYEIDDLLDNSPDSAYLDGTNIFKKTESLPKLLEYRLPLLKVLKSAIYHPNEVIEFLRQVSPAKLSKPKAKVGSREPGYTKHSNEMKKISLNNNIFGHATSNILQIQDDAKRIKRNLKNFIDPYKAEIDKTAAQQQKKMKRAANNKKRKQHSVTPIISSDNGQGESSANAKEILFLRQQLLELRNSIGSSSSSTPIQAEAVIASNKNKRLAKKKLPVITPSDEKDSDNKSNCEGDTNEIVNELKNTPEVVLVSPDQVINYILV